jgi:hypothetical protein
MKNKLLSLVVGLSFIPGIVLAQAARDWHDFHRFHEHIDQAIHEVEIARETDQYAMAGHSEKTEDFLRQAEKELRLADNSTND